MTPEELKAKRDALRKKSTAKKKSEQSRGFTGTTIKVPGGITFFRGEPGIHEFDILPYVVKTSHSPEIAVPGEQHFERTFFVYKGVGPSKDWYCCPFQFGNRDPIQEYRDSADAEPTLADALKPKERQLWLLYDRNEREEAKKLKVWDQSYHLFGKQLEARIRNAKDSLYWDLFWSDDDAIGLTLTVAIEKSSKGNFNECVSIDFSPRESPIPEKIRNHGLCLDDFIVECSYEKLHAVFYGDDDGIDESDESVETSQETSTEASQSEPEPVEAAVAEPEPTVDVPKASDYGWTAGMDVVYQGKKCSILKISKDGTSLLLEDEDENPIPGVGADQVSRVVAAEPVATPDPEPAAEPAAEPEPVATPDPEPAAEPAAADDPWAFAS